MGEAGETIGHLAAQLAEAYQRRLRVRMAEIGLSPARFAALAEIAREEGLTQKRLAERLGHEQPGVARTLGDLERDGWIERRPDPRDARIRHILLTARARGEVDTGARLAAEVEASALAPLDLVERSELPRMMSRLIAHLRG